MISYRDFAPRRIKHGILHSDSYESFDAAVAAADAWIAESHVDLLSVETVVLPNISPDKSEGTSDARVETEEAMTSINEWYQFVRVWHRK
ncbi:MAG TPA: hypothetical protein VII66_05970 [Gemmatimonadaceae bacterium]